MILAHDPLVDPEVTVEVQTYLNQLSLETVSLANWQMQEYLTEFTNWLLSNPLHTVKGLEAFPWCAYTAGSGAGIASFIYRHCRKRRIRFSRAEFILNKIVCNNINADWLYLEDGELEANDAVVISLPFAGNGSQYPGYEKLIQDCNRLEIPVLLDIAYFGISYGVEFDLTQPCITDVVCSLSKPLNVQLRLGIRFTKTHQDDEIQSASELRIINRIAAQTGVHLLKNFSSDFIISKYLKRYQQICKDNQLTPTNTITLALGNADKHSDFFRNGFYRICVTHELHKNL